MLLNINCIDVQIDIRHFITACVERDILQQLFENGMQPSGSNILTVFVGSESGFCNITQSIFLKSQMNTVGLKQGSVLTGQGVVWLAEDVDEVFNRQALQVYMDRKTSL